MNYNYLVSAEVISCTIKCVYYSKLDCSHSSYISLQPEHLDRTQTEEDLWRAFSSGVMPLSIYVSHNTLSVYILYLYMQLYICDVVEAADFL